MNCLPIFYFSFKTSESGPLAYKTFGLFLRCSNDWVSFNLSWILWYIIIVYRLERLLSKSVPLLVILCCFLFMVRRNRRFENMFSPFHFVLGGMLLSVPCPASICCLRGYKLRWMKLDRISYFPTIYVHKLRERELN